MTELVLLSQSRRLAASPRPLADVLVDTLRQSKVPPRRAAGQIDDRGQGELSLEYGEDDDGRGRRRRYPAPGR